MTATSSPKYVFISYSRRDEVVMRRITMFLREQGINVWVDNERLVPGTPIWEDEIEKAIISAGAIVVLLSSDSKNSPWVRREIGYAEDNDKRIFPILIEGSEKNAIPIRLTNYQRIDIRQNEEFGLSSLIAALSDYLVKLEAQEKRAREEAENLAREKSEREAAEKAALDKANRQAEKRIAREKNKRHAAEEASPEKIERSITRKKNLANFIQLLQSRPYFKWVIVAGALSVIGSIFAIIQVAKNFSPSRPTQIPVTNTSPASIDNPATATASPTKTPLTIGAPEHPINIMFIPLVDANLIVSGGDVMAQALNEATGLTFEVSVPTSYAATIEEMCASPTDTMAFIPAFGYVLANDLCGVDVAFRAVRRGWGVYWTMFVVARDSDIQSLEDLQGLKWAYPDADSTSGYLVPQVVLNEAGVTPGETLEAGGHPQAVRAVYTGEADFATALYSPYAAPEGGTAWDRGMDPEVPVDVSTCALTEDASQLLCDGYRVLDARANIREVFPDVVQKIRILQLSPDVPNDTISFGPEFPAELRAQIEDALVAFAETEAWSQSIGNENSYGWSGLEPAMDSDYAIVRMMVAESGTTIESLR